MTTQTASLETVTTEQKEERLTRFCASCKVSLWASAAALTVPTLPTWPIGFSARMRFVSLQSVRPIQSSKRRRPHSLWNSSVSTIWRLNRRNWTTRHTGRMLRIVATSARASCSQSLKLWLSARDYNAVIDGTNHDDLGDYRPGRSAAKEHQVRSPLLEAQMTKLNIRELSRKAGLPTWDKPALPCLSSRFPYGTVHLSGKALDCGQGRDRAAGFWVPDLSGAFHEELVRLEFSPEELPKALNVTMAAILVARFKALGFKYVTIDLEGYRSGSLNEVLPIHQ